jgi:hypothetical protein
VEIRYCHYIMTSSARQVVCGKQVAGVKYTSHRQEMVTCPDCRRRLETQPSSG